jgi:hypothetical protein
MIEPSYDNAIINDISMLTQTLRKQYIELIVHNISLYFMKSIGDFSADRIEYTLRNMRNDTLPGMKMNIIKPYLTAKVPTKPLTVGS